MENVHPVHLYPDPAVVGGQHVDVGLAEDDKQVAFTGVLEVVRHMQVRVHARFEHRDPAQLVELGCVRLVIERTGNQDVETGVGGFARGIHEVRPADCAELRANKDGGSLLGSGLGVTFEVATLGADQVAGPRGERSERNAIFLVRLLHAGSAQVFQDHLRKRLRRFALGVAAHAMSLDEIAVLVQVEGPVGRNALDGEWACHADLSVVDIRLVVQVLELGFRGNRGVDLFLSGDSGLPPPLVEFLRIVIPGRVSFARDLPLLPLFVQRGVQLFAQRLQRGLPFLPDDVDLGVVGDRLQCDVGHALVDETMADAAVHGLFRGRRPGDLRFFELALAGIGEDVVGMPGTHNSSAR